MPTEKELVKRFKRKGRLQIENCEVNEDLEGAVRKEILMRIACSDYFSEDKFLEEENRQVNPFPKLFRDIKYGDNILSIYSIDLRDEDDSLIVELNDRTTMTSVGSVEISGTKDDFLSVGYKESQLDECSKRFSNVCWALGEPDFWERA